MPNYSAMDIIGPKMVGPSSSHTAGAARIGHIAYILAAGQIRRVRFHLHGSFARTYRGHGTDRALMAGLLGMQPHDERLKDSLEIARDKGLEFQFLEVQLQDVHPNTVKIEMDLYTGETLSVVGSSVGGGNIKIVEINGMQLEFSGLFPTMITRHVDGPGIVSKITRILAEHQINIAFMSVFRQNRGEEAMMVIETDSRLEESLPQVIRGLVRQVQDVYVINPF